MPYKSHENKLHWSVGIKSFAVLGLMSLLSSLACGASAEMLGNVAADCLHPRVDNTTNQLSLDTANCNPDDRLNLVLFQQLLANYISATDDLYINPNFFEENIPSAKIEPANGANSQEMTIGLSDLPDTITLTKLEGDSTLYVPTKMVFFDLGVQQPYTVEAVVPVDRFVASINSATVYGEGVELPTDSTDWIRLLFFGGGGIITLVTGFWLYSIFRDDTSYTGARGGQNKPAYKNTEDTIYDDFNRSSRDNSPGHGYPSIDLGTSYTGKVTVDMDHLAGYVRATEAAANSIAFNLSMATPRDPGLVADARQAVDGAREIAKAVSDLRGAGRVEGLPIHDETIQRIALAMSDQYSDVPPTLDAIVHHAMGAQFSGRVEALAEHIHKVASMVTDATGDTIAHMGIVHGEQLMAARGVEEIKKNIEGLKEDIAHSERVRNSIPPGK